MSNQGQAQAIRKKFGTFGGVFTPSILTILSAILFMRANFVVGEAGVMQALIILLIANAIAILSALSVCAVSTNMQVRGGGAYFMISRVLGPEFGGAIGLIFFFALALNVAFNVLGFTEALVSMAPALDTMLIRLAISLGAAAVLFGVAFIGASVSIKTQYVIMVCLVLSVITMWVGALLNFDPALFLKHIKPGYTSATAADGSTINFSFWVVFAIFFPAATGFLAGVNMSGDLKEPMKSLPKGTLLAVFVGAGVYLITMLLGAGAFARSELIEQPYYVLQESVGKLGFLIAAGVFAATLSTALGSYLGAPRVLQAVARDRLIPFLKPFAKGAQGSDEPRRALWLTGVITFAVLLWAGLMAGTGAFNAVAAVISMVFLGTYGMLNLAAFVEAFGGNPSFRPRFKVFHWLTALLGFLGCVGVALKINPLAALIASLIIALLFWYLKRRQLRVSFGDARRGYYYARARHYLLTLRDMDEDPKNWRPTILCFAGNPSRREKLVSYAVWLEAGMGFVLLVNILTGDEASESRLNVRATKQLEKFCRKEDLPAFPIAAAAPSVNEGIKLTLQTACVGPVRPNVALFGWNSEHSTISEYLQRLRIASDAGMSLVLVTGDELPLPPGRARIDVYWRGRKNGSLLLLLAHLMSLNWEWAQARIRLIRVIDDRNGQEQASKALAELINRARIEAEAKVVVSSARFAATLRENSSDADCIMLGFELPEAGGDADWHAHVSTMIADLPTIVLVNAQGKADLFA